MLEVSGYFGNLSALGSLDAFHEGAEFSTAPRDGPRAGS